MPASAIRAFAELDYSLLKGNSQIAEWARRGGDYRLTLGPQSLRLSLPMLDSREISLQDFEEGEGHQEVRAHFRSTALAELQDEIRFGESFSFFMPIFPSKT